MEFQVETLLNNGYGLARKSDGAVIFLNQTLPGERVSVEDSCIRKRKGVFWAEESTLITSSPHRSKPYCPHYEHCGGCATLHIRPSMELIEKISIVLDNLKRIGKCPSPTLRGIDFSQAHSRFRGKFHASNGRLGFKASRENRIVPIRQCHVLAPGVQDILPSLTQLVQKVQFKGEIFFCCEPISTKVIFTFLGKTKNKAILQNWINTTNKVSGAIFKTPTGTTVESWGQPWLHFQWHPFISKLEAQSFFQSNPFSWGAYHQLLDRFLRNFQPKTLWDVHAGSGFLTSRMQGTHVLASEPDPAAFVQLKANLERQKWHFKAFHGTAEQALEQKNDWPASELDALVLDPPRGGLEKSLCDWIIRNGPAHLLYFSCDLATFCRDLAQIQNAYTLEGPVTIMNVNPGTLRVEIAATLLRTAQRSHF